MTVAWQSPVDMSIIRHRIEYAHGGVVNDEVGTQVLLYPKILHSVAFFYVNSLFVNLTAKSCSCN